LLKVAAIVAVGLSVPPGYTQVVNQAPNPVIIQPIVEQIELGPSLDVIPYVSADGYTIQMTIVPTYREFLGYDQPPLLPGVPANAVQAPMVLPKFRLRQVVTSSIVWDGQTVVLGGLMAEDTQKTKDKVPIIGDLPLLGRLFRSESSQIRKKNLLIFVTPTIIDPAGNRAHTDEEMPFAQNAVPPQKPLAPTPEVPQPKP
jgi:general secretion pathway protein D